MPPPQSENKSPPETTALLPNEDEYDSEEDSDFDIEAAPAEGAAEEDSSDSEPEDNTGGGGEDVDGEGNQRAKKRRKLSAEGAADNGGRADESAVIAELDSGDEATIRRGKEKKHKKGKSKKGKGKKSKKDSGGQEEGEDEDDDDFDDEDDDAGGEGGFVRTRGMRMKMQEERKPLAKVDQSTVDVDELWARLNAPVQDTRTSSAENTTDKPATKDSNGDKDNDVEMVDGDENTTKRDQPRPGEETITIKRKYKFAGDIITEEKVVPKDSAEAKLYLSLNKSASTGNESEASKEHQEEKPEIVDLRRPLRKISRFDPNPPGAIKRSWEKQASTTTADGGVSPGAGEESAPKGPKLNTVEKSKLDWAAYVDRTGIKDDLDVHSRAKEGYHSRMEFLNRIEDKKEEERRNARLRNIG